MFTQGRFNVEFPSDMSLEKVQKIRDMVIRLLERNSCKVTKIEE